MEMNSHFFLLVIQSILRENMGWSTSSLTLGENNVSNKSLVLQRFIGVDRETTTDLKRTPCEPKESYTKIPDQQISDVEKHYITSAGDGAKPEETKEIVEHEETGSNLVETVKDEESGSTRLVEDEESGSTHLVETVEDKESGSTHLLETVEDKEYGSTHLVETVEDEESGSRQLAETVEDEETGSTRLVKTVQDEETGSTNLVESSSSFLSSDSTSSDTSNLIGFSSGISVRLNDFSSGPTTPRAGVRKSRRNAASHKLKRMRPTTSPTYRQKGLIHESSRRLQNIFRAYVPQRNTNMNTGDGKALQKKLVNERVAGDANCRSRNMNFCEVSSPPKRKISRVRAADPLKNRFKSLWTSQSSPDRENFFSGQPYTLLSKKLLQQTANRISKSRGRSKNLGSSKGITTLKNKSIAEVYSSAPPPRTVVRHKH